MRLVLAILALLLTSAQMDANTDWGDFDTEMGVLAPDEAARVRARLAAEIASERERQAEARRVAQAEADRLAAERAARPLGERLVEGRCLTCHDAGQIDRTTLGTPGWTVTVVRMEWLNGARLDPGERAVIVAHLAARHPDRNRMEWAVVLLMGAGVAALGLGAWVWRGKRWSTKPAR